MLRKLRDRLPPALVPRRHFVEKVLRAHLEVGGTRLEEFLKQCDVDRPKAWIRGYVKEADRRYGADMFSEDDQRRRAALREALNLFSSYEPPR